MTPESQSNGTCSSAIDVGAGEIMLFGVRVKVDPMRKCVSMNDLSQYVQVQPVCIGNNVDAAAVAADSSYASADDSVRQLSNSGRERKRGVPWTEEEHKLFLLGLQKVGKGDWRGISRNYVKTRTPTQVASHAQKYFLRRSNLNRRRRRSSLFDITTDSVAATPLDEQVHEDNSNQLSSYQISPLSGFPVATFPAAVSPVPSLPFNYQTETVTVNNGVEIKALAGPTHNLPWANQSTMAVDNYPNQKQERNLLSLSLNLSLSYDDNRVDPFQAIPSFKNGDGIISVA